MGMRINPAARYERERVKARQEVGAESQAAQEALRRRFASQGLANSGASIKAEQQIGEQANKAVERRLGDIATREDQEAFGQQQIEDQRKYGTAEREAGQKFASSEALKQRTSQKAQAKAAQDIALKQLGLSEKQFAAQYGTLQDVKVPIYGHASLSGNKPLMGYKTVQQYVGGSDQAKMDLANQQLQLQKAEFTENQKTKQWDIFAASTGMHPFFAQQALQQAGFEVDTKNGLVKIGGEWVPLRPPEKKKTYTPSMSNQRPLGGLS